MSESEARSQAPEDRAVRLRRRGRSVALTAFVLLIAGLTAVWSAQIIQQVLAPEPAGPGLECRPGVRALIAAVRHARKAAGQETGGERAAMERFRAALNPACKAPP